MAAKQSKKAHDETQGLSDLGKDREQVYLYSTGDVAALSRTILEQAVSIMRRGDDSRPMWLADIHVLDGVLSYRDTNLPYKTLQLVRLQWILVKWWFQLVLLSITPLILFFLHGLVVGCLIFFVRCSLVDLYLKILMYRWTLSKELLGVQ